MVLKSSRCHFGKMRSVGSGVRHCSLAAAEVTDVFWDVFTPSMHAGRSRLRSRSQGRTAPGILLQYPTPRFPRSSIFKIVWPKFSSLTTVTSRNSRRHASSGRSPVLTANRTKSCSSRAFVFSMAPWRCFSIQVQSAMDVRKMQYSPQVSEFPARLF